MQSFSQNHTFSLHFRKLGGTLQFPFDCTELFNTTCIVNNCSCWTSSIEFPPSKDITGVVLPEYCSLVDSGDYTVTTSSDLSPLHSEITSINTWEKGTFGGWAPADDDNETSVEFSDITVNISGLVIQGMAGDAVRTLGQFIVSSCLNGSSNETFNHHGGIYNSSTIHYINSFQRPLDCLKIHVLDPQKPKKIGFRAGLIKCADTSGDHKSAEDIACDAALTLVDNLNSTISEFSNHSKNAAESIARTLKSVAYNVGAINQTEFAKTFEQKFSQRTIDLELSYRQQKDQIKINGVELSKPSIMPSDQMGNVSNISIHIPGNVFQDFPDDKGIAVVVGQTLTKTENDAPNAIINGMRGRIASPVITLMTLVDGNYTSLSNVSMEFGFEVDDESDLMVGSFKELKEYEMLEWDVDGCTSELNRTTLRVAIQCNHTTSFAVILIIHPRKLPKWLEVLTNVITKVGCTLSVSSLAAAMVTYILFRSKFDRYQFTIHINLMAAILAALLVFIIFVERTDLELICKITKYSLQYLFLSVFFWMLCEGIHLYRRVITVFETRSRQIYVFYIIGWGMPLVLVAATYVSLTLLHKENAESETEDDPFVEEKTKVCFLSYEDNSIWYFAIPAVIIIMINTFILLRITLVVVRAAKVQSQAAAVKIYQAKTGIRSALLLIPLLGTTYVIGLAVAIHPIFEVLFNVLNSLQGFFIALFYCALKSEVKTAVRTALQRGMDARRILSSTTGKMNKVSPTNATLPTCSTLIDSETLKKIHEI